MMNFWSKKIKFFIFVSVLILGPSSILEAQISEANIAPYREEIIKEGVKTTLSIDHVDDQKTPGLFRKGDDVRFRFSIVDASTREGLAGVYPAAWVDLSSEIETSCDQKVSSYTMGNPMSKPVLDLNVFYVLTLNAEPTISVVNPQFNTGRSQLLTLIQLSSPGMDWVHSKDQNLVFVSMPESRKIAVINTVNWNVVDNIDVPTAPHKLSLQAHGQFLLAACQGDKNLGEPSGLAIIDVSTKKLEDFMLADDGIQDLLIRKDGHFVYVSNEKENKVTVFDAHSMQPVQELTCQQPSSIAYSEAEGALYVISETTGGLTVIDGEKHEVIKFVQLDPGICQIKFEPSQRYAFIVNSKENNFSILDASINRVVQVGNTESEPDQVNFSEELAYVRHRNSEMILMILLTSIGNEGSQVQMADFPGGFNPPGRMTMPSLARGIVQVPDGSAVLVANAPDKVIYYYKEGMAAPMGSFSNYRQEPRAVMVIDRGLKEVSPGNYETVARLESNGIHDVAFFIDAPRLIHCFRVNILSDPKD